MQHPEALVWALIMVERAIWEEAVRLITPDHFEDVAGKVLEIKARGFFVAEHLGVCRQCDKVYLKPKHGTDALYCSQACTQKAYRERKKEKEGRE